VRISVDIRQLTPKYYDWLRGYQSKALRTVETAFIRDVVYKQYTHGASVVGGGNRPETLLSSSIPYLQLDSFAIKLDCPDLEVDANGCDE
jgi:hypothetical protein